MIRRPPRSTLDRSSAASDVYKRQLQSGTLEREQQEDPGHDDRHGGLAQPAAVDPAGTLSLIHISEPTRPY